MCAYGFSGETGGAREQDLKGDTENSGVNNPQSGALGYYHFLQSAVLLTTWKLILIQNVYTYLFSISRTKATVRLSIQAMKRLTLFHSRVVISSSSR
jgi:hypothetical protein